jgi:hypothetical protein
MFLVPLLASAVECLHRFSRILAAKLMRKMGRNRPEAEDFELDPIDLELLTYSEKKRA